MTRDQWDAPGLRFLLVDGDTTLVPGVTLLEAAWQLKEAVRTWYATATAATAADGLDAWIEQVKTSGFDPLRKALSAFVNWRQEILAFFQFFPHAFLMASLKAKTITPKH